MSDGQGEDGQRHFHERVTTSPAVFRPPCALERLFVIRGEDSPIASLGKTYGPGGRCFLLRALGCGFALQAGSSRPMPAEVPVADLTFGSGLPLARGVAPLEPWFSGLKPGSQQNCRQGPRSGDKVKVGGSTMPPAQRAPGIYPAVPPPGWCSASSRCSCRPLPSPRRRRISSRSTSGPSCSPSARSVTATRSRSRG